MRDSQDFRATSLETLRQMVATGAGLTLLPELAVRGAYRNARGVVLRPFARPVPVRHIGALWRKSTARQAAIDALVRADQRAGAMSAAPAAPLPVSFPARDGRVLAGLLVMAAPRAGRSPSMPLPASRGSSTSSSRPTPPTAATTPWSTTIAAWAALRQLPWRGNRLHERLGRLDMPGALDFMARFPGLPAFTLGHSVGGQLLGCLDNANRARAHVMVAAAPPTGDGRAVPSATSRSRCGTYTGP